MKKILFYLFLYFSLTVQAMAMNSLRLGIEESILLGREAPLVKETVEALNKRLEREIIVNVFSTENLKTAVENNEVDLFISSASFFSSMGKSGVKDLATAVSDRALDPNYGKSAAVLIRAKANKLSHLEDLKERKVFFNPKYGEENLFLLFGEFGEKKNNLAEEYEIFKKGLIKKDISLDRQIEGLLHGDWDAVILPGCQLETESEKLPISSLAIDVLQPKIHSNLRCVHSTALYPNITIGTLPSVSASLSRQLSIILLSLPPTKQGMLWGTASDFSQIDKVLRLIDRDANASDRKWSFSRVLAEYWFVFLGALGLVIGLLLHSVRSEHLVQKRTAQLTASLKKQEQLKKQAVLTEEKLGKLQRLGTISQMSSLFAHELRQPLNAIRCYTFSMTRLLKKEKLDPEKFQRGLKEITEQVIRADNIIQKVRDYVKNKTSCPQLFHLKPLLVHTIKIFEISHKECKFDLTGVQDAELYGEPLEVELIFSNLIKNAYEAVSATQIPSVFITAQPQLSGFLEIKVWDNGPWLPDDRFLTFEQGLKSTKADGLGLGLSIVRTFVEKSGGNLALSRSDLGGLLVTFTLPIAKKS